MQNNSKFTLNVFISSAMGEESGTEWLQIRKSIKETLFKCDYLKPFIIEEHATEIPSSQFFTWYITQADIVVILVKNEIRPGTQQEIEIALEKNKPILVYFYNADQAEQSVIDFKEYMILKDVSTFRILDSFMSIDELVFNDVLNNMITYYKFKHDIANQEKEIGYNSSELILEDSILDKKFLTYFGNNQKALQNLFSLSDYGGHEDADSSKLGTELLEWLYNGEKFVDWNELVPIWESLTLSESIINILELKHQSTQKYFNKDFENALKFLDSAFILAEESNAPEWLLGEILIDSRNISGRMDRTDLKYQSLINERDKFIYFPIGDRYLKNAFEKLEKERLTLRTLSPSTVRFGNTLLGSLQDMENYVYVSFMMGSSTHLLLGRKKVIELLIEYGELYRDDNLIYQAIRLMVLSGNAKMFSEVLQKYWDTVNDIFAVKVDDLWNLTEVRYCNNVQIMKCLIIGSLGQYMNNSLFREAMTFLFSFSKDFEIPETSNYLLDALDHNLERISEDFTLDMMLNFLNSNRIMFYDKVTNILSKMSLTQCEQSEIEELSNKLIETIDRILQKSGQPYFIVNLLEQHEEIFSDLYEKMKSFLSEKQIDYIDIELGNNEKAEKILIDGIEMLRKRFIPDNSVQMYYGDDPLASIVLIIENFKTSSLIEILNEKFVPLVIEVLSSRASLEIKESYLESLITLLVEYKKIGQEVPIELKEFFMSSKIELKDEFGMDRASVVSSKYYINTINSLIDADNLDTENSMFITCVGYKEKPALERKALSYSIQKYIEYNLISVKEIPLFINLVVLDMLRDEYFVVRKNAIKCTLLLYKVNSSELFKGELIRMTLDSSPNVKGCYLNLLKEDYLSREDKMEILKLFSRDASYNIRESSLKQLKELENATY